MLKIYMKSSPEEPMVELQKAQAGCWIHADSATQSDLNEIAAIAELDIDDLTDALDKYEIPRIEREQGNLFIFTRYPSDKEPSLYTSTLSFILTHDFFITVSPQSCDFLQTFIEKRKEIVTHERTNLLTALLLRINQEFTSKIRRVRYSVLSAKKEKMSAVGSDDIADLTTSEEVLNQYLSSLSPARIVLQAVRSGRYLPIQEDEEELLEDSVNATIQSEELCDMVLKTIRSLREAYQTIFTNNLHKTIKLLTSLTIILSIPTMIASVYGMNVNLPLAKNTFAFGIVMGFTAILSVLGLWIFRRKGWL